MKGEGRMSVFYLLWHVILTFTFCKRLVCCLTGFHRPNWDDDVVLKNVTWVFKALLNRSDLFPARPAKQICRDKTGQTLGRWLVPVFSFPRACNFERIGQREKPRPVYHFCRVGLYNLLLTKNKCCFVISGFHGNVSKGLFRPTF